MRMGQGVRTGLGHRGITYVLQTQFSTLLLNDLLSETTASMSLEFHMEHDSTPGLQADRIQPGRESKMGADTKK